MSESQIEGPNSNSASIYHDYQKFYNESHSRQTEDPAEKEAIKLIKKIGMGRLPEEVINQEIDKECSEKYPGLKGKIVGTLMKLAAKFVGLSVTKEQIIKAKLIGRINQNNSLQSPEMKKLIGACLDIVVKMNLQNKDKVYEQIETNGNTLIEMPGSEGSPIVLTYAEKIRTEEDRLKKT